MNSGSYDKEDLIARTAKGLRTLAGQIERGKLSDTFEHVIPMADIGTERMEGHCKAIAARFPSKSLAVYSLSFDEAVPLQRVYDVVDGNRSANLTKPVEERTAFARVNKRDGKENRCLYVGKSEKVALRLKEHLTKANRATYAIHMNRWPSDIPGSLIVRVIEVADIKRSLLPFLEDQLAGEMQPILGRRGSA